MSTPTHGLIIRPEWLAHFFAGRKHWEVRSRSTRQRGPIALIGSGTGCIQGLAHLSGVEGPLDTERFTQAVQKGHLTGGEQAALGYPTAYGWVLDHIQHLKTPIPYPHPQGAVIWVRLTEATRAQMEQAAFEDINMALKA